MKRIVWVISGINRRMMKLLVALALIAYIACEYTILDNQNPFICHCTVYNEMVAGSKYTLNIKIVSVKSTRHCSAMYA